MKKSRRKSGKNPAEKFMSQILFFNQFGDFIYKMLH